MATHKNSLRVTVIHTEKTVYDGEVYAVSSENEMGNFDILPFHENFIGMIRKNLIIHKLDGTREKIDLDRALIRVSENVVSVFLGITSI